MPDTAPKIKIGDKEQAFFVTRSKDNIKFITVEKQNVDHSTGVLDDVTIRLTGY